MEPDLSVIGRHVERIMAMPVQPRPYRQDRSCISYWLPRLEAAGVRTPETCIVKTAVPLINLLDGKLPEGYYDFLAALRGACRKVGPYPVFLRTGQTSGKHDWFDTCFVQDETNLPAHVARLVEFSECADFFGLPWDVWAARKFVPMRSAFTAFNGFPVNVERRYFIRDGEVVCSHPYWPEEAVAQGKPKVTNWRQRLDVMNRVTEFEHHATQLTELSRRVSRSLPGYWSLDWSMSAAGDWYAIDAAQWHHSFHWPDCPHAPQHKE